MRDACRNYQTKWLCGTSDGCMDAASPDALAAALRRMYSAYDVVGVTEHMHDTVRVMAARLPRFFPAWRAASTQTLHLNRNPHPPLSPFAQRLLAAWNSNDIALYVVGTQGKRGRGLLLLAYHLLRMLHVASRRNSHAEATRLLHRAAVECDAKPEWQPEPL